jgi:CRISPR system Cascade subunit CasE
MMFKVYRWTLSPLEYAQVQKGSNYKLHQKIWSLYGPTSQARPFLYREDVKKNGDTCITILSKKPVEDLPSEGVFEDRQVSESFLSHTKFLMSIKYNPVVSQRTAEGKGVRIPLVSPIEIEKSFIKKIGENKGFSVERITKVGPSIKMHIKKDIILNQSEVTAVINVTDRELFEKTFLEGIGYGRGFGFGLLALKPL